MDKTDFLHRLKGLRTFRCPEQALYRVCTKGAQIFRVHCRRRFYTFVPVDMHGFVHTPVCQSGGGWPLAGADRQAAGLQDGANSCCVTDGGESDAGNQHIEKKFCGHAAHAFPGLQTKQVYKDSSSVNNWHFLWISLLTDEKSLVYARYKPVTVRCIAAGTNLDKILLSIKSRVFAQSVPVDIKNLIHRGPSFIPLTIW